MRYTISSSLIVRQTSLCSFFYPCIRIAVAVEDNPLVFLYDFSQQLLQFIFKLVSRNFFHLVCNVRKFTCNDGIQHVVRASNVFRRTNHSKFKPVAGESERRSSVSVGGILREIRKGVNTNLKGHGLAGVSITGYQSIQNTLQFFAHKDGDDCRRCFICTQSVVICGRCGTDSQQVCIFIHALNHCTEECQELQVFHWSAARIQQVLTIIGSD